MNKKYALQKKYFQELNEKILRAENILFFCDYDGTLAPFNPVPAKAKALPESIKSLRLIAEKENYYLSLVSGRKLSDLKNMIQFENANYAGSHGLEIELLKDNQIIHPFQAQNIDQKSKEIYQEIKEKYQAESQVELEDKGFGIALHFNDEIMQKEISDEINKKLQSTNYQLLVGRKIVELRPQGWNKGKAVNFIAKKMVEQFSLNNYLKIYIGDDRTDEDAFKVIEAGISIYVQNEDDLNTEAEYYLKDPHDTAKLLELLAGEA
ncbi:trehalose-phosphatase [Halanaerobium hydrogeniformans]|uniref:Trehalose 6-phosphate phosphatase n=1 Tax=Halanaerobium hydrogeniformans TaxID=656519 RepID=E4RKN4_HALHG|nr:trehalose-phosphatase [Halanaerobium hydrogeniformans]ADQ15681.1 trehalose-phosphatase [Halanaerobium hydrogeniformans]